MPTADEFYDQGLNKFGETKHEEAVDLLKQALELDSEHVEATRALGMTYYHLGRYQDAIEAGKRLVELVPEDILAHTSLSMYYQKADMVPEAEAASAQARLLGWKDQLKNDPQG